MILKRICYQKGSVKLGAGDYTKIKAQEEARVRQPGEPTG